MKKFIETKTHLERYINQVLMVGDVALCDLDLQFLTNFEHYLKTERGLQQITINKLIQRLRKVIKLAMAEGYLFVDPFILYKPKKVHLKLVYLTQSELRQLQDFNFSQSRLEQVRDMFVFCCYTGLAYQEMSDLRSEHIVEVSKGEFWIEMMRRKTGRFVSIPLLPGAQRILEKYNGNKNLLPIISNQKFNSYLKEIAHIVGISKNLTHHVARKTFATTILLNNDVAIDVVSELLGHSKMATTQQHYAQVMKTRIGKKMKALKEKLIKEGI